MPRAFDGTVVPETIDLPCGEAHWDDASGCSYRCWKCMAVVGSIAMPKQCKTLMEENVKSEEDLVKKRLGFDVEPFQKEKHEV